MLIMTNRARHKGIQRTSSIVGMTLSMRLRFRHKIPIFRNRRNTPMRPRIKIRRLVVRRVNSQLIVRIFIQNRRRLRSFRQDLIKRPRLTLRPHILTRVLNNTTRQMIQILLIRPMMLIRCTSTFNFSKKGQTRRVPRSLRVVIRFTTTARRVTGTKGVGAIANTTKCQILLGSISILTERLAVARRVANYERYHRSNASSMYVLIIRINQLLQAYRDLVVTTTMMRVPPP